MDAAVRGLQHPAGAEVQDPAGAVGQQPDHGVAGVLFADRPAVRAERGHYPELHPLALHHRPAVAGQYLDPQLLEGRPAGHLQNERQRAVYEDRAVHQVRQALLDRKCGGVARPHTRLRVPEGHLQEGLQPDDQARRH